MNGNDDRIYHSKSDQSNGIWGLYFFVPVQFSPFHTGTPFEAVRSPLESEIEHMQSLSADHLESVINDHPEADLDINAIPTKPLKTRRIRKTKTNQKSHESVAAFIAARARNPNKKNSEIMHDIAKERGCTVRAMYKWIHQNKDAHQYIKKYLDPQTRKDIVQDFLASKANNPHLGNTVIATRVGAQYSVSLATVMRRVNKAHPGVYFFLQSQS